MIRELTYEALNGLDVWRDMATTTLDQMRTVKLMNRIDTKYVISDRHVLRLLEYAKSYGYYVQESNGVRAMRYDTLYYDTTERSMYLMHHNRHLTRQKVRTRTYLESGQTFLEIKNKSNRGRTLKQRVTIDRDQFTSFGQSTYAVEFYKSKGWYNIEDISPALSTRFTRITLVNQAFNERLTIDLNLKYEDVRTGRNGTISSMAIVELKQDGRYESTMKSILRSMRISPLRISKYCLGTALTVEGIKRNMMNEKLRAIEKRIGYNKIDITL